MRRVSGRVCGDCLASFSGAMSSESSSTISFAASERLAISSNSSVLGVLLTSMSIFGSCLENTSQSSRINGEILSSTEAKSWGSNFADTQNTSVAFKSHLFQAYSSMSAGE